jgi:hypothetical protein
MPLERKAIKKGYLQPPKLNPIRRNKEAITRILKNPSNELRLIWHLDTLLIPEYSIELKKIKQ